MGCQHGSLCSVKTVCCRIVLLYNGGDDSGQSGGCILRLPEVYISDAPWLLSLPAHSKRQVLPLDDFETVEVI